MSLDTVNTPAILSAAVGAASAGAAGAAGPGPGPEDKYRFYQCVFEPLHITCRRVNTKEVNGIGCPLSTTVLPVESWMPEGLDRAYIRWRLFKARRLEFKD